MQTLVPFLISRALEADNRYLKMGKESDGQGTVKLVKHSGHDYFCTLQ